MIDIGRGDQENFEKKNCGQSPQKIRNKSASKKIRFEKNPKKIRFEIFF